MRNKTGEDNQISEYYSDADYQDRLNVDPLTAMDEIRSDLSAIEKKRKDRQEAKAKAEAEAKAKNIAEGENDPGLVGEPGADEERAKLA